jgi:hypothetical protein
VTFPPLFILSLQFVVFVFFLTGLQQFIILDFVVVSKYFDPIQIKVSVLAFHSALNLLLNKDQILLVLCLKFSPGGLPFQSVDKIRRPYLEHEKVKFYIFSDCATLNYLIIREC